MVLDMHCRFSRKTLQPSQIVCKRPQNFYISKTLYTMAALKNVLALQSHDLLRLPPRAATAEGDVAIHFAQSAQRSTAEHDALFANVRVRVARADGVRSAQATALVALKQRLVHVPAYDKWDDLFLEYRVDWPLHLLLTPEVGHLL